MEFKGRKKIHTHLDIAPLIDIVFLLLIFFMLSSHFVTQSGIKIVLPKADTAKLHQEQDIIIFISEHNDLHLNEESLTLDTLLSRLKTKVKQSEKKTVIIKADEKINLGLAVKVMDIAKQANADGLIISTKMKQQDEIASPCSQ